MTPQTDVLSDVLAFASGNLATLADRPVASRTPIDVLRQHLALPLPENGTDARLVVEELIAGADPGMIASTSARFFGWVMGGALPSALAADWLVSVWDQNAAIAAASPASAIIEEVVGGWLKELLGLDGETSYAFTTGCQMSHATCLAAARNAVLARIGWNVEHAGLRGSPDVRIITGSNVHASVGRSVRLLGFGEAAMEILPEDQATGTLQPAALAEALERHPDAKIVILQAGDLNIGAFDDLSELIPMAQAAGAWVHVDGAFGLWVRASDRRRHLVEGIELADSIATDAHKWLNVPYDSGIAFVRQPDPHRAAMQVKASYIAPTGGVRDQMDWGPEWSRRARAIPLYAAIRELGRQGLAELVDRTCDLTHSLATKIGALEGARLERSPQINQAIVYFLDGRPGATDADHDARTDRVLDLVNESGEAFFTGTVYRGRRAMRLSVSNWQIGQADVERVLAAVSTAVERAAAGE